MQGRDGREGVREGGERVWLEVDSTEIFSVPRARLMLTDNVGIKYIQNVHEG